MGALRSVAPIVLAGVCLIIFGIILSFSSPPPHEITNAPTPSSTSSVTVGPAPPASAASVELAKQFQAYWDWTMNTYPTYASYLGVGTDDSLENMSMEALTANNGYLTNLYNTLSTFDRSELSSQDLISLDVLLLQLSTSIESFEKKEYQIPISQMVGLQIDLPGLVGRTSFKKKANFQAYFRRLAQLPTYINQTIALMEQGIASKRVLPCVLIQPVADQIKVQSDVSVENSTFFEPFLNDLPLFQTYPTLVQEGYDAVEKYVLPSFKMLYRFWTMRYAPNCATSIATGDLPAGNEFYRFLARYHTTTQLSPQAIHDIGTSEVERIVAAQQTIITELGWMGTFDSFVDMMRTNPDFYDTSEDVFVARTQAIVQKATGALPALFGRLPRCPVAVKPIPAAEAPTNAAAYYNSPSTGCTRPGVYSINTYDLSARPKFTLESMSLHEAVPGHHLQIALAMELEGVPEFRKDSGFNAFVEGWALYSEVHLGKQMGFYTDPYNAFGQLGDESLRACRLVVDTGMHALGWTREQSVQYMLKNTPLSELDIRSEVDRYLAMPGQALSYKIGELKIWELRQKAETELGDNFDIRAFHDVVLGNGALPLTILESQVNEYIQSTLAAASAAGGGSGA